MDEFLDIKYKLSSSDNFEEFTKAIGMGYMVRKIVTFLTPTVELKKEGDTYSLITYSTFKTMTLVFKLGEEFDEVKPDGTILKTTCTIEGNKLITKSIGNGREILVVREFSKNEIKAVMTCGEVVCNRVFTAI